MKNLTFILIFCLISISSISAQTIPEVVLTSGDHNTLLNACSGLSNNGRVIIKGIINLNESLIIEEGITLVVHGTGLLSFGPDVELTINGAFEAGLYKVFEGDVNIKGTFTVNYIVPQWFGAKTNNSSFNCAPAINTAIRVAQNTDAKTIVFPTGKYWINEQITFTDNNPITIRGEGATSSKILVNNTLDAIFSFNQNNQCTRFCFMDLFIQGNSKANYCIKGEKVDHLRISRVRCSGSLKSAVAIGYGWCNNIIDCEISYNKGHGIEYLNTGANNISNIIGTRIFANDGIGILHRSGNGLNINGCTIETNKTTGIYVKASTAINITGNYFEKNASDGLTADNVGKIYASIILTGHSVDYNMGYAYPIVGVQIKGNTQEGYEDRYFVYASSLENADVGQNSFVNPSTKELFLKEEIGTYSYKDVLYNNIFVDSYVKKGASEGNVGIIKLDKLAKNYPCIVKIYGIGRNSGNVTKSFELFICINSDKTIENESINSQYPSTTITEPSTISNKMLYLNGLAYSNWTFAVQSYEFKYDWTIPYEW